jgi:hypothetical protein
LNRRDKNDPTDLEEITTWASIILFGGGLAGLVVVGLIALVLWAL